MRAGLGKISRRHLFLGAGALVATRRGRSQSKGGPVRAYAGTFSAAPGRQGDGSHGQGIFLFTWDPATGKLTQRSIIEASLGPSWLALDATGTHMYAANTRGGSGRGRGSVAAYAVDRSNGNLTLLNSVGAEGSPTHLSIHPSGKFVLVANYGGGTAEVFPILPAGGLGPATDIKHSEGKAGSIHPASGPPGNFSISGHEGPHIHGIIADPSGRFVFANDLGLDRMYIWKFDAGTGKLSPGDTPTVDFPPGDGPRHLVFHPNGKWLYSLQEESSTVAAFDFEASTGKPALKQTLSTLPKGFAGTNFPSEIVISPDSRFIYVANRLHDSVAGYSIRPDGALTFLDATWTRGDYPRSITVEPAGNYLYSLNERSDDITTFRIDRRTGELTFTGEYTPVGSPAVLVFMS
jgi:6-phosphogluconolactonase